MVKRHAGLRGRFGQTRETGGHDAVAVVDDHGVELRGQAGTGILDGAFALGLHIVAGEVVDGAFERPFGGVRLRLRTGEDQAGEREE